MTKMVKGTVVNGMFRNINGTWRRVSPSIPPPWVDGGSYGPYVVDDQPAGEQPGQYSKFTVSNGKAVYDPTGHEPVMYVYLEDAGGGFSAMSLDPL